jgi:hypothetical protein
MPKPERKGAPLHLRADDVAEMIVAATIRGDKAVAAEYGVSVETIQRYRRRMLADAAISTAVAKKREAVLEGRWRQDMQIAMAAAVDFLMRAPAGMAHTAENVRAVAGALKLMSEAEIQARLTGCPREADRGDAVRPSDVRDPPRAAQARQGAGGRRRRRGGASGRNGGGARFGRALTAGCRLMAL